MVTVRVTRNGLGLRLSIVLGIMLGSELLLHLWLGLELWLRFGLV